MNPHAVEPLTLYSDDAVLPDGPHNLRAAQLLEEPDVRTDAWGGGCMRRLIAASSGPIASGDLAHGQRLRLEAAGWFVASEDASLGDARLACWPTLKALRRLCVGMGSPRPSLVLVGELTPHPDQLPFESRAGAHLLRALRLLGYDELTLYLANAFDSRRRRRTKRIAELGDVLGSEVQWVGLGQEAQGVMRAAKLKHVEVVHPAYHARYQASDGPVGFAGLLDAAGVQRGPWRRWDSEDGDALYVERVDELSDLRAPYSIRTCTERRLGKAGPSSTRGLDPNKAGAAHRMYVTGEAPTVQAAAEAAGANVEAVRARARDEGWREEREEHQRRVTSRAMAEAEEKEARAMSNARKLACACTERALGSLARQLAAGTLIPTPGQAKQIVEATLLLCGHVQDVSPERDAMGSIPLMEQAQRVVEQIEKGLGGG